MPQAVAPPGAARHTARYYYRLALVLFALGLMSKPMVVTLPFVLLLLDFWPWQRFPGSLRHSWATLGRLAWEKAPFFGLAAGSCLITFLAQDKDHAVRIGLSFGLRLANAIASYFKYLGLTLWPVNLAVFYPHPALSHPAPGGAAGLTFWGLWPLWQTLAAALLLAAISGVVLLRCRRSPWALTGWFWFLGTLVPVIGLVQVGSPAMADRYTYLPLIGFFLCLAWGATDWLAHRRLGRPGLALAGVLLLAGCALLTHRQARFWRNNYTLFDHALAVTADNAVAHCQLGGSFLRPGPIQGGPGPIPTSRPD